MVTACREYYGIDGLHAKFRALELMQAHPRCVQIQSVDEEVQWMSRRLERTYLVVNVLEKPSQNKDMISGKHKRIGFLGSDHGISERSAVVLEFWICPLACELSRCVGDSASNSFDSDGCPVRRGQYIVLVLLQ